MWQLALVLGMALTALPGPTQASNEKARVILEMERVEHQLASTRWHLNSLDRRDGLKRELNLLRRLYDAIIDHEADLMAFPCAGADVDVEGGPPRSTESSDTIGRLTQSTLRPSTGSNHPPPDLGQFGQGFRFAFARTITDVEVRLLAMLVYLDHRLETETWHWNNQDERKRLMQEQERLRSGLRRVRNGRC